MTEAQKFLDSILLEKQNVMDLLTSDQTFVNNTLARYYGIEGPATSAFKEVTLTDPNRFGLLGKAAVLMRTSYADRTSPVLRGAWVLDKIIGTPPTPPPPNVGTNLTEAVWRGPENRSSAAGSAPRQAGLQAVPRRDRSDRPRAGEL